jgi:hypothetical protein
MPTPPAATRLEDHLHHDRRWQVVERAASSQYLKSSARLRDFLFYIAGCALRDAPGEATEQQIGIHVFGRIPGYNSSEDSIVRTHARLLRQKLAAYFEHEGADEEILVEVPKGHYLPIFTSRFKSAEVVESSLTQEVPVFRAQLEASEPTIEIFHEKRRPAILWFILPFIVILTVATGLFARPARHVQAKTSSVDNFWRPFFTDDPPFVIYSNAVFTGDSVSGLRYASHQDPDQSERKPEEYVDTYTGIGELASVYDLTRLFDAHHAAFTLKRSQLVAWDEARNNNLIFLGAPVENPSESVLQPTTDFTNEANPGFAGIVNHHPRPGEPAVYSRPEHPLTTDYAIVALLPGVQPGKRVLRFSGLTTFGTQAAVEYMCRPESADELLKQITGSNGEIRPFEAVLETTIGGGVTLQTHLVTLRVH